MNPLATTTDRAAPAGTAAPADMRTRYLEAERETVETFMPGLAEYLAGAELLDLEQAEGEVIRRFREAGGPALVAPADQGGLGASAVDVVRMQRALGSWSPSLAVGTTMHHLSLATLIEFAQSAGETEQQLVAGLVEARTLIASGFAEGRSGQSILAPTMRATQTDDGYAVTGQKKPCSLSRSMDLLTASVAIENGSGAAKRGIALIPGSSPGIEREPFWSTWVLRAAESDALRLNGVTVPADLVLAADESDPDGRHEKTGFVWFETLISASYVGVASALVERVLREGKRDVVGRLQVAADTEAAMAALEGIAWAIHSGERGDHMLARTLFVRYSVQRLLSNAVTSGLELLGGMAFIGSSEIAYLCAAAHALAFHPPSRASAAEPLTHYLAGAPLELP